MKYKLSFFASLFVSCIFAFGQNPKQMRISFDYIQPPQVLLSSDFKYSSSGSVTYEEEVLMEKQTAAYKSGSGTLDNRINNGTLILGQNIETDGVVGRKDKKLYGGKLMGMKSVNNTNTIRRIKGTINSSVAISLIAYEPLPSDI